MLRHIVLLSVIARCAAFGSYSGPGGKTDGACIDEPDHVVAEEAAKIGYAQYTSCAAIAQAGGCQLTGAACCATCASSGELIEQRAGKGNPFVMPESPWGWGGSPECPNAYTVTGGSLGPGTHINDVPECGNCLPGCVYGHGCRDHGDGYANWCYIDRPGLIENACVNQWTGAATAYIGRGAVFSPASGRLWSYCCRLNHKQPCGPSSVCPSNYPYAYRPTRNFDYCCATADGNGAYTEVTKNAYCGNRVISKYAKDVEACFAAVKADPACGNGFSFYGGTNYGGTKYCDCPPRGELCEAVPFNTGVAAPNIYTVYSLNRELGANRNPWMQYRSGSCKDDKYIECAKPPCDDHGGVGTGRLGWESKAEEVVLSEDFLSRHRRRSGYG